MVIFVKEVLMRDKREAIGLYSRAKVKRYNCPASGFFAVETSRD
jgi:hypothetical protein